MSQGTPQRMKILAMPQALAWDTILLPQAKAWGIHIENGTPRFNSNTAAGQESYSLA